MRVVQLLPRERTLLHVDVLYLHYVGPARLDSVLIAAQLPLQGQGRQELDVLIAPRRLCFFQGWEGNVRAGKDVLEFLAAEGLGDFGVNLVSHICVAFV